MNSKFLGILALVAAGLSALAGLLDGINPKYALIVAAVGAAVAAFTEKITGGVSADESEEG